MSPEANNSIFLTDQKNASAQITLSGLEGAVLVRAVIHERISQMFNIDAVVQTKTPPDITAFIGQPACITIINPDDKKRYFSGIVANATIENVPTNNPNNILANNIVTLSIVPTFFKTSLMKKYRIFQEKSCMDIIQEVLKENGITNNEVKLSITTKINCCVQYGETDYEFISRLVSAVGGIFYFKHEKNKDTLCITDASNSGVKLPDKLIVRQGGHSNFAKPTDIYNLTSKTCYGIKKVNVHSYSDEKKQTVTANAENGTKNSIGEFELYSEDFIDAATGNKLAQNVADGINSEQNTISGDSAYINMSTGSIFSITESTIQSQNTDYLLVECTHIINEIADSEKPFYTNKFVGIPSSVKYKPAVVTSRKKIGPQTAIVTGPSGEEIYCDDDGRIKVKFIWDSRSKEDEKSSYWVRVAHFLANKSYGSYYIPRIGSEVCVLFLNQDADIHAADIPIVVSSLYNGVNKPHYQKTDNTVMALYTNSSKGGGGYNEIRIDDKKDNELVYLHMQKDYEEVVERNMTTTIVKGDASFTNQEGNVTYTVKKGNDTYLNEKGNVDATMSDGNYTFTLTKGNVTVAIQNGNVKIDINGDVNIAIKKNANVKIDGDLSLEAKNIKIKANAAYSLDAAQNITLNAKQNIQATASASISAKATSSMSLEGKSIDAKANTGVTVKATTSLSLEGLSFTLKSSTTGTVQAGAQLKLSGAAMVQVQGAMVKLG